MVTSCGVFRLISRPVLPTFRPRGRLDYQILYVASGKAHFYINGEERIISSGHMILYRPKEMQRYYYYGPDHPEVYWLHFTGSNVKNILRSYGIADNETVLSTGTHLEYKQLFLRIMKELSEEKSFFEDVTIKYFEFLMILIQRNRQDSAFTPKSEIMEEMDEAVRYFHEHYQEEISIQQYTHDHNISVSWFIKNFREYTGCTPNKFIINLKITNAQTLLKNTAYNISEIASILGYENPLYFSRIFSKIVGCSPSEYRSSETD